MTAILSAFIGGTVVALQSRSINALTIHPTNAQSSITVDNGGSVSQSDGVVYSWLVGGTPAAYEILATLNSGSLSVGTTGSWLNLGTSQSWALIKSGVGVATAQITLQIRPVGGAVVATATINFDSEVD